MRLTSGRRAPLLAALSILAALVGCGSTATVPKPLELPTSPATASPPAAVTTAPSAPPTQDPAAAGSNPVYGMDLGIHVLSGNGPNDPVPDAEIRQLLKVLQGKTTWVRLYNVLAPWKNVPKLAHEMGFKVSAAAYLSGKPDYDETAIAQLVDDVNAGYVDYAQAGNEPVWTKALTPAQSVGYIEELKQKVHGKVPVGTSEPHPVLIQHPEIMRACDLVLANLAPISWAVPLDGSLDYIKSNYAKMVSLAGKAEVGIGETNWPSHGLGGTVAQEARYFSDFEGWARAKKIKAFYFEAFDEPYFAHINEEGPHWGIWTSDLKMKAGMAQVFSTR